MVDSVSQGQEHRYWELIFGDTETAPPFFVVLPFKSDKVEPPRSRQLPLLLIGDEAESSSARSLRVWTEFLAEY